MRYLTYDGTGKITGSFIQDLRVEHSANYVECTEAQADARFTLMVQGGVLVAASVGMYNPPPAGVPVQAEKRKLLKAIINASQDTAFDSALPQNGGGQQGKLDRADWNGMTVVNRNSVLLERIRVSAGWTQAQVDAFFTTAAGLNGG